MAGARRARRPAHAGDEAHRRRRPGPPVPDARLRAPPPRRGALERRGDREPGGDHGRRDELRRWARPQLRAGRHRSGRSRLRPRHGGADGERRLWRRSHGKRIRTERAGRRLPLVRGQAALVRAAGALAGRDAGPGEPARHRRRLQRRAHRRGRLERGGGPRRDARLGTGAGRVPGPARDWGLPTRGGRRTRTSAASRGGTTGPATSSATRGCGSTTSSPARRRPRGSWRWRSTARPARGRRRRPTMHRSSWTSTSPGKPFDAGWSGSDERFAARRAAKKA